MIEIACRLLEPGRPVAHDGAVRFYPDGTVERSDPLPYRTRVEVLEVSARIGASARRIGFDDGVTAETSDNDALDRALAQGRGAGRVSLLDRFERRWGWALAAVVASVLAIWLLVDRGVPAAADRAAAAMPAAVRTSLGSRTLDALERSLFEASALDAGHRERLRARFDALASGAGPEDLDARLLFRKAPGLGANALAIPGGTVVVTDALVGLADSDEEVLAVLAHELAHVAHRHGLRTALQNTGIAVLVIAATGDVSWLATALPSAIVSARYSRRFERAADDTAIDYLRAAGIDPANFRRILVKLRERHGEGGGFLASHPATSERLEVLPGD